MSVSLRQQILGALQASAGMPVSGASLAARLGVSRTAVWKHIATLRREGYPIEGRSQVGYRLLVGHDPPTADAVAPFLQTRYLGKPYSFWPEVTSTNSEARRLAEAGAAEGATVVADRQTQGRGRRGRGWLSEPGTGIWMSVILRPPLAPSHTGMLTLLSGVAVQAAITTTVGVDARLKWPNDVYIAQRKVCGILVELAADQERVNYAVIGIGLNVRPPAGGFPDDVIARATTLESEARRHLSRPQLTASLCQQLEIWYERLQREGPAPIRQAWRDTALWLGRIVTVNTASGRLIGRAEDISDDGGLVVRAADTKVHRVIYAGDVDLLRPEDSG